MQTPAQNPDLKHLVLLGGGHAQVAVLKSLIMAPVDGLRVTLISRDILTPYSGMLPGYVEGLYEDHEITIDLSHLARLAGARFIHGEVTALDANRKKLTIKGRPEFSYDLLSINIGSSPDLTSINGASKFAIPVKPISRLLENLKPVLAPDPSPSKQTKTIAIIGAGAAGVEMAFSLHHRLVEREKRDLRFIVIQRGSRIMVEFPKKAADMLMTALNKKGIAVLCGHGVQSIHLHHLCLDNGYSIDVDHTLVVTAGRPARFLAESGLTLDDRGFIAVSPSLQSVSHDDVFAAGDIASVLSSPRPKAGVFAVRAGAILTGNLRKALLGARLEYWQPQRHYLALVGIGDRKAMAIRGNIILPPSRWLWHLKEWIDRRFIEKFTALPEMPLPTPSALAKQMAVEGHDGDAALAAMRCLGCGAKTGFSDLEAAINAAQDYLQDQGHIPKTSINITTDSAIFTPPPGKLVQSVDAISALVDDPFILGRIAALHAMSDLFASNAKPLSALAILTLPHAFSSLQRQDITQLLAGAMLAFHEHDAALAGGHTSEGNAMQVGFAVTGVLPEKNTLYIPKDGDAVILTKPLGVGVIFAAHQQGHPLATGHVRQQVIDVMTQSNDIAASIFSQYGSLPMTDVTGFGLARHGLSLMASIGDGTNSITIPLDDLPVLSPALELLADHNASSLHHANRLAAPVITKRDDDGILYDPQTGGGLLAILPQSKANQCLNNLKAAGLDAAIIGHVVKDGRAEIRAY